MAHAHNNQRIYHVWAMLKYTYGIVAVVAGVDKFFNMLVNWLGYVHPSLLTVSNLSAQHFIYGVGIIEIVVGLAILSNWTRLGGYVLALWLIIISGDLVVLGRYDIAVRDTVMAVGALALALLSKQAERE